MATESVTNPQAVDPEMHGAAPVHGNFTAPACEHLWCAEALGHMVGCPSTPFEQWHSDIQDAVRFLLSAELTRARKAMRAEDDERRAFHQARMEVGAMSSTVRQ